MKELSRGATFFALCLLSGSIWHVLEGFELRYAISSIPALLALQLLLSDTLENIILPNVRSRRILFPLFIAPGTILHEMSHLVAAKMAGCQIEKVSLFSPNPRTGVLGFVSYRRPNDGWVALREFFIAFAPFFSVGAALLVLNLLAGGELAHMSLSEPPSDIDSLIRHMYGIYEALLTSFSPMSPYFLVFLWLQFCLGVGAAPSPADFRAAYSSLFANPVSSIFFISSLCLFILSSEGMIPLFGRQRAVAEISSAFFGFTSSILLVTVSSLALSIPLAWLADRLNGIRGISKTVPPSSAILCFYVLSGHAGERQAFAASIVCFFATLMLLSKKGQKGFR